MNAPLPVSLDIAGPAAPPRSNGELVFAEPWESRAFGLAMTLSDAGAFDWEDFRQALIARIAAWQKAAEPGACYSYYRCWLEALQQVLVDHAVLTDDAVRDRVAELAARPAGWDHGHDHH
jgi:nitrile hydratase accessory protein